MWSPPTIEHDSAIKRNEVLVHAETWMHFENSMEPDGKGHLLYDSICMNRPEWIHRDRKYIDSWQGLEGWKGNGNDCYWVLHFFLG